MWLAEIPAVMRLYLALLGILLFSLPAEARENRSFRSTPSPRQLRAHRTGSHAGYLHKARSSYQKPGPRRSRLKGQSALPRSKKAFPGRNVGHLTRSIKNRWKGHTTSKRLGIGALRSSNRLRTALPPRSSNAHTVVTRRSQRFVTPQIRKDLTRWAMTIRNRHLATVMRRYRLHSQRRLRPSQLAKLGSSLSAKGPAARRASFGRWTAGNKRVGAGQVSTYNRETANRSSVWSPEMTARVQKLLARVQQRTGFERLPDRLQDLAAPLQ